MESQDLKSIYLLLLIYCYLPAFNNDLGFYCLLAAFFLT